MLTLGELVRKRRDLGAVLSTFLGTVEPAVRIEGPAGELVFGDGAVACASRHPVLFDGEQLGWVAGGSNAAAVATLLGYLAGREAERRTLANEVLHLYREVNLIYRFSEQLASTLDLDRVAAITLEQARQLIAATDGAVLLLDEASGQFECAASFGGACATDGSAACCQGLFDSVAETGQGDIINDVSPSGAWAGSGPAIASVICTPLRVKERVTGLIALSSATPVSYTAADLKLLNTLALQTASAIENARLFERTVQAARDRERLAALHKELEVASRIQRAIVPSQYPPFPGRADFSVRASMTPARAVGGDFFDFFLVDPAHLGFVVADVSGKGVPSALFMAVCRTLIKATAEGGVPPEACLARVNRVLASEGVPSMYVTVFYGLLDTGSGRVTYCNAGHNPPFVIRARGAVEPLAQTGGTVVGLFEHAHYESGEVLLGPGDALFTYTDGVTEACDTSGEEFTTGRLQPCLARCGGAPLDDLIAAVTAELTAFVGEAPQGDDITMLAVRYSG